jgi:hypothetical protein
MKASTEKLVAALEAQGAPTLKNVIRNARKGYYHEFDSDLVFPLAVLKADLEAHGFTELAQKVVEGEFDAGREEAEMWNNSLEGMAAFNDPALVEYTKGMAKAISEVEGIPWNEDEWNGFIDSNRFPI